MIGTRLPSRTRSITCQPSRRGRPEVEDDQVGRLLLEGAERVGAVAGDPRAPAVALEPERDELRERRLVLDDEDPLAVAGDRAPGGDAAHPR